MMGGGSRMGGGSTQALENGGPILHPAIVWRDNPSVVTSHPGTHRVQEFLLTHSGHVDSTVIWHKLYTLIIMRAVMGDTHCQFPANYRALGSVKQGDNGLGSVCLSGPSVSDFMPEQFDLWHRVVHMFRSRQRFNRVLLHDFCKTMTYYLEVTYLIEGGLGSSSRKLCAEICICLVVTLAYSWQSIVTFGCLTWKNISLIRQKSRRHKWAE